MDRLQEILRDIPSGIGEIGLDACMNDSLDAEREQVFRQQLDLSHEWQRPVSLHCRNAWPRMLDILLALPSHPAGMLIHAYSGPPDAITPLAKKNAYFSFGGSLSRRKSDRARRLSALIPPDRLQLESDAPDLPPDFPTPLHGDDGRPLSEPSLIPQYAAFLPLSPSISPAANTCRWLDLLLREKASH
jgi:TatD DNase family protein